MESGRERIYRIVGNAIIQWSSYCLDASKKVECMNELRAHECLSNALRLVMK